MVSPDVKFSFTFVPLENTTEIIIKRIHDKYEMTIVFIKLELKKKTIDIMCKKVHFSVKNGIYIKQMVL